MRRLHAALVATALLVSTVAVGPAAADGFVAVSATVTPTDPVAEEQFAVVADISNADDSDSSYNIRHIELRRGSSENSELLAERDLTKTVVPGESGTVDIESQLNESGTHTVYLHISLWQGTNERVVVQPVTVQVRTQHPQMGVTTDPGPAGEDQTMTVSVSNGLDKQIRNVELTVDGDAVEIRNPRRVAATVADGGDTAFEFRVTPDAETVQNITATLRYTAGENRSEMSRTLAADFSVEDGAREHPQLDVSTDSGPAGDEQTMTVSVSNGLQDAIRNVEVTVEGDAVEVRNPRRAAATVASGEDTPFEFRVTPESTSIHDVDVAVQYTLNDQRRNFTRTLATDFSVTDTTEHPQVEILAESAAPGEPRTTTVTLSNGLEQAVRNVELTVGGERVSFNQDRRVTAAVGAGESQSFEFSATPAEATTLPVEVSVQYTVDGERRGVSYDLATDFSIDDEPTERPQVDLSVPDAIPGATRPVNVTVANGLEHGVRQLLVRVSSPQAAFDTTERVRARLGAGRTATFHFPATVETAGSYPVNVTMLYTDDGVRQRVTRTFQPTFGAPSNPGEISLTGVDATLRGGELEISATASNIGSDTVNGVVVSTGDDAAVDSANYFVGEVDGSDFSSFTLSSTASGNVSSVSVQVRYVVDGVEKTYTTDLPVDQVAVERPDDGGGGLPVVPIVAVVVVLVAAAAIYRRRG